MLPFVANEPGSDTHAHAIETLLDRGDWPRARWLLFERLQRTPDDHWLWSKLALTWVEEGSPGHALTPIRRALRLAPNCGLALWYHGGILDLLGLRGEAISVYGSLIERGVPQLATGECGLGRARAVGLLSDSCRRLSMLHEACGDRAEASVWHARHLHHLGDGHVGIYKLDDTLVETEPTLRWDIRLRNTLRRSASGLPQH